MQWKARHTKLGLHVLHVCKLQKYIARINDIVHFKLLTVLLFSLNGQEHCLFFSSLVLYGTDFTLMKK